MNHLARLRTPGRTVAIVALIFAVLANVPAGVLAQSSDQDSEDSFYEVWARADQPVANRLIDRTWIWGPSSFSGVLQEEYLDSPGGSRAVAYFDKSRMEINRPSGDPDGEWYVTNGLLARDLILGQVQVGDDDLREFDPPQINVAGDRDDPNGPTYQTFNELMDDRPLSEGTVVTQTIDRSGNVGSDGSLAHHSVTAHHIEGATNHSVASVFWEFMNSRGPVMENGHMFEGDLFENPYYATGYPLTEPYWTTVRVGGDPRNVLIQVFERRVLTYTPANPEGWQVEAGNAGRHYHRWYYEILGNSSTEPASDQASCLDGFEQQFLQLINDYRQTNGVGPLENSAALNSASHLHSQDMGERGFFAHVSPDGATPWDRMDAEGYDYNTLRAENIAAGQSSAERVFEAWRNSEGHNRNMLDPDLDTIGIGRVEVPGSEYGVYWTTKFGGHVDAAPAC
jgi:uncharacterized protein YkwD